MNRQPRTLLTLMLAAVAAVTAWLIWRDISPAPPPGNRTIPGVDAAARPTRGGSMTTAVRAEPRSFNRLVANNASTELFSFLTQGRLVRVNRATGVVEPWLAEKWDISPDGTTFTFTLREAAWSDGTPFTAADVLFSAGVALDRKTGSILADALQVAGKPIEVTSPDAKTVVVKTSAPFGPGVALFDNLHLVPRHKLEAAVKAGRFAEAWSPATPPSDMAFIGPFVLTRYDPGQRLVFDRNPRYWRKAADGTPLPYLDQVIAEIIPDQNAEALRLQSGGLDVSYYPARPEDLANLRPLVSQGRMQLYEMGVSTDPDSFFFNLRPAFWAKDPRGAWMSRKEFRQAISHAVDREAFANEVFFGAAVPIWGPVTPGNQMWFSPNVKRYPHSPDAARTLLAGLGLSNRDGDEWLEDAKGTEARFTIMTPNNNTTYAREVNAVKEHLRAVGIAVDVATVEFGVMIGHMQKGTFESLLFNFAATSLDPSMNKDFWLSSGSAHVWNLAQETPATPWEKQIDDLTLKLGATTDLAARQKIFFEVQQIFAEELPILYFASPRIMFGASTRITNLTPAVLRPQLVWSIDTIAVAGAAARP